MSRKFGKVMTTIWQDPDWEALSDEAMLLYVLMISQHDISAAGVVTIAERRWKRFLDHGSDAIDRALAELEAATFVVVDEDTAEVLVRTFIKHDGRLQNSKLAPSVHKAVQTPMSEKLRHAAHDSLREAEVSLSEIPPDNEGDPTWKEGPSDLEGRPMPLSRTADVLVPTRVVGEEPELEPSNIEKRTSVSILVDDPTGPVDNSAKNDGEEISRRDRMIRAEVNRRANNRKGGNLTDEIAWKNKVRENINAGHGTELDRVLDLYPNAPDSAIAARAFQGDTSNKLSEYQTNNNEGDAA